MREETLRQVALSLLPGLGPYTIRQLISYCGSATAVFQTSPAKLSAIPGIGKKTVQLIKSLSNLNLAKTQLKTAAAQGASVHFFTSKDYPDRLKPLEDAPVLLFSKGKPAYNRRYTLGVVGTRRPTKYGISVIEKILTNLLPHRPTIVSGLAYGIDITAHLVALKLNLPTVGVLGSSLDRIYPDAHHGIAQKMFVQGGLLTELKFGTKPEPYHFPARNRIIAGLSDALIIVEARKKGGALITAGYSRLYGKKCFAIPGALDAPASVGCNQLIAAGQAHLLTSGKDLVEHLSWQKSHPKQFSRSLPPIELQILKILGGHPAGVPIDQLCRKTQIPINKMASYLLNLEIKGFIKAAPGKKFVLVGE